MANLKGSSFEKQLKNGKIRIEARGISRHQKEAHLTHSNAIALKRDQYFKEFANYASSLNRGENKLNRYLDNKTVESFLQQKTESLSLRSAENYTRGFSALTDALKSTGITVNVNKEIFNSHVNYLRENKEVISISANRDIENIKEVINNLNKIDYNLGAIATIQSSLGLRVSEAIELFKNAKDYIGKDNMIRGLVGKGNHLYEAKAISLELQQVLNKSEEVNYQAYQKELKALGITSHDMRYTYVKERMEELLNNVTYKEALSTISKEINHTREDITEYYLSKTSF